MCTWHHVASSAYVLTAANSTNWQSSFSQIPHFCTLYPVRQSDTTNTNYQHQPHPFTFSHTTPSPLLNQHLIHFHTPHPHPHPGPTNSGVSCTCTGWITAGCITAGWLTTGWGSGSGGRSGPWGLSFLFFFLPRRFQLFTSSLVGGGTMPSACRKNANHRHTTH